MYKTCKTIESATRQREFEICLLNSMTSTPYKQISVTDLCIQIGIARKNFYRYFENKDDVLLSLIDHTIMDYPKYKFPFPDTSQDLIKEIEQYLTFWQAHHELLDALEKNHLGTLLVERILIHAWRFDNDILQTDGTINDPNNVIFVISGLVTLIFIWHHGNYQVSKKQLAYNIHNLLSKPLFTLSDDELSSQ